MMADWPARAPGPLGGHPRRRPVSRWSPTWLVRTPLASWWLASKWRSGAHDSEEATPRAAHNIVADGVGG